MNMATTISTISAGGIVQNEHHDILVVAQLGGIWSLPKGHIDEGEDELTAAKREIYEESGVSIAALNYHARLGSYTRYKIGSDGQDDVSESKTLVFFHFTTPKVALAPIDPFNPEARWVPKSEVTNLLSHPKDRAFYLSVLERLF